MLPTVQTSGGYKICLSSQNQLLVQTGIVVPWLSSFLVPLCGTRSNRAWWHTGTVPLG